MFDEYDFFVSKYDHVIDVYQNSNIQHIISHFLDQNVNENISKITREELVENLNNTINRLRNALEVLDYRMIVNIGGKVAYYCDLQKYDSDIARNPKWILVQVHKTCSDPDIINKLFTVT